MMENYTKFWLCCLNKLHPLCVKQLNCLQYVLQGILVLHLVQNVQKVSIRIGLSEVHVQGAHLAKLLLAREPQKDLTVVSLFTFLRRVK